MSLAEKYGLNPQRHMAGGDDLPWADDGITPDVQSMLARLAVKSACVVGIETCPARESEPGYAGITYLPGWAFYTVVLQILETDPTLKYKADKDSFVDTRGIPTTRKNRLSPFWVTVYCVGNEELMQVLNAAQPHPDYEEENR